MGVGQGSGEITVFKEMGTRRQEPLVGSHSERRAERGLGGLRARETQRQR